MATKRDRIVTYRDRFLSIIWHFDHVVLEDIEESMATNLGRMVTHFKLPPNLLEW